MWYCNNEKCEAFEKERCVDTLMLQLRLAPKEVLEREVTCPKCGKKLHEEKIYDTYDEPKGPMILTFDTFSNKSDKEKKSILRSRAKRHFNKHDKEIVDRKKAYALQKNRNAFGLE